jgi:hypothetical protein
MNAILEAKVNGQTILRLDAWQIYCLLALDRQLPPCPPFPLEIVELYVDGKLQEPPPDDEEKTA